MRATEQRRRPRGAASIEYGIVLVLLAITVIIGYRAFGKQLRCAVVGAGSKLQGSDGPSECQPPEPLAANGGGGGGASGGCEGAACLLPGNCFVAGTLVLTDEGEQPIESVTVGERVLARDEAGALAWQPVLRTFARSTDALVRLTLDDGGGDALELTPDHRLFVDGRGWVAARDVAAGESLLDADGADVVVGSIESIARDAAVFNLEVAELHSYFVGSRQIWAHNECSSGGGGGSGGGPTTPAPTTPAPTPPAPTTPAPTPPAPTPIAPPSVAPPSVAPPSVSTESAGPGILSQPPPAPPLVVPPPPPAPIGPPPSIITPSNAAPPAITQGTTAPAQPTPQPTTATTALTALPNGHLTLYADIEAPGMLGGNLPTVTNMQEGAVGHAFIGLNDGSGHEQTFGMWPDTDNDQYYNPSRPWQSVGGMVRNPDDAHVGEPNLRQQQYPLTPAQVAAVNAYIDSHRNPQTPYNLFGWKGGQNCVTFACGAVSAAGYRPPPHSTLGFPNPNTLHNNLPPPPRVPSRQSSTSSFGSGQPGPSGNVYAPSSVYSTPSSVYSPSIYSNHSSNGP